MKMIFTLLTVVALTVPAFANAEMDMVTCGTFDRSVVIQVAYYFLGNYDDVSTKGDKAIKAQIRVIMRNGKKSDDKISMDGSITNTAQGPNIELISDNAVDGTYLNISAPASQMPSELKIYGKDLVVSCF